MPLIILSIIFFAVIVFGIFQIFFTIFSDIDKSERAKKHSIKDSEERQRDPYYAIFSDKYPLEPTINKSKSKFKNKDVCEKLDINNYINITYYVPRGPQYSPIFGTNFIYSKNNEMLFILHHLIGTGQHLVAALGPINRVHNNGSHVYTYDPKIYEKLSNEIVVVTKNIDSNTGRVFHMKGKVVIDHNYTKDKPLSDEDYHQYIRLYKEALVDRREVSNIDDCLSFIHSYES